MAKETTTPQRKVAKRMHKKKQRQHDNKVIVLQEKDLVIEPSLEINRFLEEQAAYRERTKDINIGEY